MATYEIKHSADGSVLGIQDSDDADGAVERFARDLYATRIDGDDDEEEEPEEEEEGGRCRSLRSTTATTIGKPM